MASCVPPGARSVAVTLAGALSVYEIWLESVCPSPFGVIVRGTAVADLMVSGTGFPPIVPVAGRTLSPAPIVQRYSPGSAVAASQVQSTSWLRPVPVATMLPAAAVTGAGHRR